MCSEPYLVTKSSLITVQAITGTHTVMWWKCGWCHTLEKMTVSLFLWRYIKDSPCTKCLRNLIYPKLAFQVTVNQKTHKRCLMFAWEWLPFLCVTSADYIEVQYAMTKTLKFLLYTYEFHNLTLPTINLYTSLMVILFYLQYTSSAKLFIQSVQSFC